MHGLIDLLGRRWVLCVEEGLKGVVVLNLMCRCACTTQCTAHITRIEKLWHEALSKMILDGENSALPASTCHFELFKNDSHSRVCFIDFIM